MQRLINIGFLAFSLSLFAGGPPREARAQTQVKPRVMVVVDTSGSMVWHFTDNNTTGGDGDTKSLFTDITQANRNFYPGRFVGGMYDGPNSRLYAAKKALTNVVNATGDLDFGLMRYAPNAGCPSSNGHCCSFNVGACVCAPDYVQNPGGNRCNDKNAGLITWAGGCGPPDGNFNAMDGGQILVSPSSTSAPAVLQWVDNVEDYRDNGAGQPRNGELRGAGPTPVAGATRTALNKWYRPIYSYTKNNPSCNPANNPLCDPQIDCRPYVFVFMTDGADTCETTDPVGNPPAVVRQLHDVNPNNPVLTYVIGVAINDQTATNVMNNMAAQGGTGAAKFANSQADIQAALADIVASSVKYELCNNKDDNCNNQIDEGFDKGVNYTVGQGVCLRTGVKKCSSNGQGTQCCVNDGQGTCTPLAPGNPTTEVCNGKDDDCNGLIDEGGVCQTCNPTAEVCDGKDNDCNGQIDDNPIDVGKTCGFNLGLCMAGTTACVGGKLVCNGGKAPGTEICNGCDDDCDGVTDGMTQECYSGPNGTKDVGICRGGNQACTATTCNPNQQTPGPWGTCVGEVKPGTEVCNGLDDDCNNKLDDVPGTGGGCCPSGKCGMGQCAPGSLQCSGGGIQCVGAVGPTQEVCDGVDNDCNGKVDDLPGLGGPCSVSGGCGGTLVCDVQQMKVVCKSTGMSQPEVCNGLDDNCNGLIDEEVEVVKNDTRVNKPCGNDMSLPLPCKAGNTVCLNGKIVCQGAVGPASEVCDGKDNNCDGMIDNMAPCPMGFDCYNGGCYAKCMPGEFPCPGGYSCDKNNYCVPDKCQCGQCQKCVNNMCVDSCQGVTCGQGFKCSCGACIDASCVGDPSICGPGFRCDKVKRECVADPCSGKMCGTAEFCDPTTGGCAGACTSPCPTGQRCDRGNCVADPCANRACITGQTCDPKTGKCVDNPCVNTQSCVQGFACVNGMCVQNPCDGVVCPTGTQCTFSFLDGTLNCEVPRGTGPGGKRDEVVGVGGGGLACSTTGAAGRGGEDALGFALLALALAGIGRRRRGGNASGTASGSGGAR